MQEQANTNYNRIAEAISYIQENFKSQPGLEEVAGKIHVSPFHFFYGFWCIFYSFFALRMLDLSLGGTAARKRTCQEVYEYARRVGPQSPSVNLLSSPDKNAKFARVFQNFKKKKPKKFVFFLSEFPKKNFKDLKMFHGGGVGRGG